MESLHDLNKEWASMLLIHIIDLIRKNKDLNVVTKALACNYERYKETVYCQYRQYPFGIGVFYMNMLTNINIINERIATVRSSKRVEYLSMFYQVDDSNHFNILLTDKEDAELAVWTIDIDGHEVSIEKEI